MAYFTKDFLDFFKELAANNNKEWFDSNRKRYEKSVKNPFAVFVDHMIARMKKLDPKVSITSKDAIFRINRDIRFSKDKTPYKTSVSAIISRGGKKDKTSPGMYIELSPEHVRIYGGVYEVDKDQLQGIRTHIASDLKTFDKLISEQKFKKLFGEVRGEKNKILPAELKEAAEQQPLIFNKNFYYFAQLPPEAVLKDDLADTLMDYYNTSKPVGAFLAQSL